MPSFVLELPRPRDRAARRHRRCSARLFACCVGRFPRKLVLRYRTRAALSSRAAWHAAHRGYTPFLIGGGFLLAVSSAAAIIIVLADATGLVVPAIMVGIVAPRSLVSAARGVRSTGVTVEDAHNGGGQAKGAPSSAFGEIRTLRIAANVSLPVMAGFGRLTL